MNMKNKTILLSALFMGLVTMEKVSANCPQNITYKQYNKLIVPSPVDGVPVYTERI